MCKELESCPSSRSVIPGCDPRKLHPAHPFARPRLHRSRQRAHRSNAELDRLNVKKPDVGHGQRCVRPTFAIHISKTSTRTLMQLPTLIRRPSADERDATQHRSALWPALPGPHRHCLPKGIQTKLRPLTFRHRPNRASAFLRLLLCPFSQDRLHVYRCAQQTLCRPRMPALEKGPSSGPFPVPQFGHRGQVHNISSHSAASRALGPRPRLRPQPEPHL